MTAPKIGDKFIITDKNAGDNELVLLKHNHPIHGTKSTQEIIKFCELPEGSAEIKGLGGIKTFTAPCL